MLLMSADAQYSTIQSVHAIKHAFRLITSCSHILTSNQVAPYGTKGSKCCGYFHEYFFLGLCLIMLGRLSALYLHTLMSNFEAVEIVPTLPSINSLSRRRLCSRQRTCSIKLGAK